MTDIVRRVVIEKNYRNYEMIAKSLQNKKINIGEALAGFKFSGSRDELRITLDFLRRFINPDYCYINDKTFLIELMIYFQKKIIGSKNIRRSNILVSILDLITSCGAFETVREQKDFITKLRTFVIKQSYNLNLNSIAFKTSNSEQMKIEDGVEIKQKIEYHTKIWDIQ